MLNEAWPEGSFTIRTEDVKAPEEYGSRSFCPLSDDLTNVAAN